MSLSLITPARLFTALVIALAIVLPHVDPNTRAGVALAVVVVYVICYTIVRAIETHKGVTPTMVEEAVRKAVYDIRAEDSK